MPARIALILLCCVFWVPASAHAGFSADRQLAEMTDIGTKFWTDHGLTRCAGRFHWEWDENFVAGALAEAVVGDGGTGDGVYDCQGWLKPSAFNWRTRDWRTLATRCMIIVHEMGHGEGLEHTDDTGDGIMDSLTAEPPRACRHWARSKVATAKPVRSRLASHFARSDGALR